MQQSHRMEERGTNSLLDRSKYCGRLASETTMQAGMGLNALEDGKRHGYHCDLGQAWPKVAL